VTGAADCPAAIPAELRRLRTHYERAMSRFKFDEANALQQRIAALEAELAASGPPARPAEPPTGIIPVLARPRRRRGRAG
jgi:hypothetical protein